MEMCKWWIELCAQCRHEERTHSGHSLVTDESDRQIRIVRIQMENATNRGSQMKWHSAEWKMAKLKMEFLSPLFHNTLDWDGRTAE